jgi:hypothetical protein
VTNIGETSLIMQTLLTMKVYVSEVWQKHDSSIIQVQREVDYELAKESMACQCRGEIKHVLFDALCVNAGRGNLQKCGLSGRSDLRRNWK